ncbi:MAG: oligosaccharide flippase family protein [Candidatus Tenebribacter burtonii]|jgi:O-antigen/teichoic acid export membrane protein|nr:oligosaccharide flippase family protein [Candidatus Tenebribacter burtonii]
MVKRNLLNKAIHYTFSSIINKGTAFLVLPVISNFLAPGEYAVYALMALFSSIAALFYQVGIHQSLMTFYHKTNDNQYKSSLVKTSYFTIILNGLFLTTLIILFRTQITNLILSSDSVLASRYTYLLIWFSIISLLTVIKGITLALLNIRQNSKSYSKLSLSTNIVFIPLFILSAILGFLTLDILVKILFISSLISAIFAFYYMQQIISELNINCTNKVIFSWKMLKEILPFSIIIIPATISILFLQSADRYMLSLFSPDKLHDTGIYAISYKVGMILSLLTSVFDLVFFPFILKLGNSDLAKKHLKRVYNFYLLIGSLIGYCIIIFSQEIFLLFNPQYAEGGKYVFIGVISVFMHGLANIIVLGLYILRKSKKISAGIIIGALINIGLNYILIPEYGMLGAGIASILAYLFIVIYDLFVTERIFAVGYNPFYLLIVTIIFGLISWLNFLIESSVNTLFYKLGYIIIGFLILLFFMKKNREYKNMIIDLLQVKNK